MIFRKGGRIRQPIRFLYKGEALEIVTKFTYLGIVFTVCGSLKVTIEKNCLIKCQRLFLNCEVSMHNC